MDELQYLTDEERGPVLEVLLTQILLNPKQPQLVGLSAVLGKSEALAQWLRAKMIREEKRPVELRQGVFFDGKFRYREFNSGLEGEEDWFPLKSEKEAGQYVETAKFLVEDKGEQTIVFLPDKPTTEALAHHLSHALNLPPAAGAIAEMNALEESVSKDMLITFLSSGVAVHNADLSWEERDIVERYTRRGEIRVLCTTTTLAVGLNLPMKNAIVAPLRWKYFRDTPVIFMDEGQQLFFYRGCPTKLQPASFQYLLILAGKPKQIVARDEIYRRLRPGPMNYKGSNKPYERQISDHKRRCIAQIKKGSAEIKAKDS